MFFIACCVFFKIKDMEGKFFDMGSNEPHATVDCPVCGDYDMVKVAEGEHITTCDCKLKYTMKNNSDGSVGITFTVPMDMMQ